MPYRILVWLYFNKYLQEKEHNMKMRHAKNEDLDKIMKIIGETVKEMNENGNFQWDESYPNREVFINDIKEGTL